MEHARGVGVQHPRSWRQAMAQPGIAVGEALARHGYDNVHVDLIRIIANELTESEVINDAICGPVQGGHEGAFVVTGDRVLWGSVTYNLFRTNHTTNIHLNAYWQDIQNIDFNPE